MKLHSLLSEDLIISDLKSITKDEVLKEIVKFLKSGDRISRDKDLYDKLIQREKLGSTAIGDGVAIPHCKLKGIKSPLLVLGISHQGVNFDSLDGKPSYLFFLVVSSPDNPSMSLKILAAIAQLVRNATTLPKRVLEARSPKAIIEIVRDEEDKPHG
jgi:PTS system nitrogen regulatory IIA component